MKNCAATILAFHHITQARIALLALAVWLCAQPCLAAATSAVIYTREGEVPLSLELATTPEQREQGLMQRDELAPHDGMLFLFPNSDLRYFWMKDTKLPLDLLFIDHTRTIVHIGHGIPYALKPIPSTAPAIAVIELDAGRAARESIAVGDKVNYALPPSLDIR